METLAETFFSDSKGAEWKNLFQKTWFGGKARMDRMMGGTYLHRFHLPVSSNRQVCNAGEEETS